MKIEAWGKTDKGMKRSGNQDCFLVDQELDLYIVADGMGGHKGGEVASEMAVQVAHSVLVEYRATNKKKSARELIQEIYTRASAEIFARSEKESKLSGMGTTMVLILREGKFLYIGNVGDSRCYLQRDLDLWQLTEDHSLIYEQLREGLLKESDLADAEGKNIITRSVGYEKEVVCDVLERELIPGDHYILCSDGLSGMLTDHRINEICLSCKPDEWPERMIKEANDAGGDDNISVVCVSISK